jgi:hypothetical protein
MRELIIRVDDSVERGWDGSAKVFETKELVRCKDCKWAEVSDNEHTWCDHVDHESCHGND